MNRSDLSITANGFANPLLSSLPMGSIADSVTIIIMCRQRACNFWKIIMAANGINGLAEAFKLKRIHSGICSSQKQITKKQADDMTLEKINRGL